MIKVLQFFEVIISMLTYIERASQYYLESSIDVLCLLSSYVLDAEKPK